MANSPSQDRFTKIYLTVWGVCILIALLVFAFYKLGFRLTNNFEPVKVGSLEIASNEEGLQIFLDNREQTISPVDGRYVIRKVTPGLHSVVVSKDGFWPWAKTVTVTQNDLRQLYAFVFPMDGLQVSGVSPGTPEYTLAKKNIEQGRLPEPKEGSPSPLPDDSVKEWLEKYVPNRKLSSDKSTALYTKDNTIYAVWLSDVEPPPHYFCQENPCTLVMPVLVSNQPVKNVDFYKGRRDTVIFSSGTSVYGIEVDREGTQNFQPLYKGSDPRFYQSSEDVLYIQDRGFLSRATL